MTKLALGSGAVNTVKGCVTQCWKGEIGREIFGILAVITWL